MLMFIGRIGAWLLMGCSTVALTSAAMAQSETNAEAFSVAQAFATLNGQETAPESQLPLVVAQASSSAKVTVVAADQPAPIVVAQAMVAADQQQAAAAAPAIQLEQVLVTAQFRSE